MNKDSSMYKMCLLGIVCAVCGILLAVVNSLTAPVIEQNKLATIKTSLEVIYPGGSFKDVSDEHKAKDTTGFVDAIYEAEGSGYIFQCHGVGYNSAGLSFLVGFNNDGSVSGFMALEQNETSGIGSRYFDEENVNAVKSISVGDAIPMVSGATLTSTAVKNGIEAAEAVFNQIN